VGDFNAEAQGSHDIVVRATAADGEIRTERFSFFFRDLRECNIPPLEDTDDVAERSSTDAAVSAESGDRFATDDLDDPASVSYSIDDPRFQIDANGIVTIAGGTDFDAETEKSVSFTVTAVSSDGSRVSQAFNLTVAHASDAALSAVHNAAISATA